MVHCAQYIMLMWVLQCSFNSVATNVQVALEAVFGRPGTYPAVYVL